MEQSFLKLQREMGPLRDPLLVAAFIRKNGFNSTAAGALHQFESAHDAELLADVPPDQFFDFTVMPPTVRLVDDQRVVDWPRNELRLLRGESGGPDVITLAGIEPHLRWPAFADALLGFLAAHEIRRLVVLRTWPAPVPHTRPTILRLTTTEESLAAQLGLRAQTGRYEGPVDFGGLLGAQFAAAGGITAGLGAIVPNYLGVVPNPLAMLALTEAMDRLAGTQTPLDEIRDHAEQVRARADEEMRRSDEVRSAVEQMEAQYESVAAAAGGPLLDAADQSELPSPDDLLQDIERFLRAPED